MMIAIGPTGSDTPSSTAPATASACPAIATLRRSMSWRRLAGSAGSCRSAGGAVRPGCSGAERRRASGTAVPPVPRSGAAGAAVWASTGIARGRAAAMGGATKRHILAAVMAVADGGVCAGARSTFVTPGRRVETSVASRLARQAFHFDQRPRGHGSGSRSASGPIGIGARIRSTKGHLDLRQASFAVTAREWPNRSVISCALSPSRWRWPATSGSRNGRGPQDFLPTETER